MKLVGCDYFPVFQISLVRPAHILEKLRKVGGGLNNSVIFVDHNLPLLAGKVFPPDKNYLVSRVGPFGILELHPLRGISISPLTVPCISAAMGIIKKRQR